MQKSPTLSKVEDNPYERVEDSHGFPHNLRFLLYCHDTFGLGHLRRTISLAEHFTSMLPDAEVLIVTGSPVAHAFTLPPRVDYIKLPSVTKDKDGSYRARDLSMEYSEIRDLRATILCEAAQVYHPDIFIVDHAPQGWKGEVLPTLSMLQASQPGCLRVIGLRDILDSSHIVRKNWVQEGIYHTIEKGFDLVLVYGSQQMYDLGKEYALPRDVIERVHYCGYLHRVNAPCIEGSLSFPANAVNLAPMTNRDAISSHDRKVVVTTGGGGDGFPLMEAYLQGLQLYWPLSFSSVLLTGPLMPNSELEELKKLASSLPQDKVRIEPFLADPLPLMKSADLVIAMAGYNTSCELLEMAQRSLIIPRTTPRQEQLIRATLLARHGLTHMLHPDQLTPRALIDTALQAIEQPRPQRSQFAAAGITFRGQANALQAILKGLSDLRDEECSILQAVASAR